jgi:hypothetical protein
VSVNELAKCTGIVLVNWAFVSLFGDKIILREAVTMAAGKKTARREWTGSDIRELIDDEDSSGATDCSEAAAILGSGAAECIRAGDLSYRQDDATVAINLEPLSGQNWRVCPATSAQG